MSNPQTVTHYLIERELGRGAMGVVYLGFDTRLGRPVAVKSLPLDLATDPERRQRFETEARTLAAINHPNIASIYGLEQQDGSTYLILEFVEGPTLTERIHTGAIPVEEVLSILRQVALGIDAAHQRGIIHRDLKPENIKLRPDGVVKVLDFGIAMPAPSPTQAPARHDTPTIAVPPRTHRTAPGLIVGTPGYMSPEQARGKPVSLHTDVWALACVLFECLTAESAFAGESLADALAATLYAEPDWTRLPSRTPSTALELLRASLQKDVRNRPQTMGAVVEALDRSLQELKGGARVVLTSGNDDDFPPGPGNLSAPTSIISRDREMLDIARFLGVSRLVTLTGPSGAGRSTLAAAAGAVARTQFSAGAWIATIPPVPDGDLPDLAVALSLGARGRGVPSQAAAARVAARPLLLVMTGCEHGHTACSALAHTLLGACPNLRILATSRAPLGLEGEAVVCVGPLAAPAPEVVARGEGRLDAARLFVERTKTHDASFVSSTQSTHAIAELCRRLGGWPLALELAAAMSANLGIGDLAERLEQRARLLGVAGLEVLPADGVHRLMVRWVLDMLPPGELAVLLAAWAFAAPASVKALSAAGGARESVPDPDQDDPHSGGSTIRETKVEQVVARLVSRALLAPDASDVPGLSRRFRMHDAVRRVAGEWLRENSAVEAAVISGHRAYHLASAEQASRRWGGAGGSLWLSKAELELPEYFHAARLAPANDAAGLRLKELVLSFRSARGL